ncbi:MAG: CvpA family protein [Rickettsiales bacterium]|nr:CvpA family protein [Rickettsiales bacterium]
MTNYLSYFDLSFVVFTLISVLIGFSRGFVKEIFSLIILILSFYISCLISPFLIKILEPKYFANSKMTGNIIINFVAFFISTVVLKIITAPLIVNISSLLKNGYFPDRSLGFLFGALKSILYFSLFYSMLIYGYNLKYKIIAKSPSDKQQQEKAIKAAKIKDIDVDIDIKNKNIKLPEWLIDSKFIGLLQISSKAIEPITKIIFDKIKAELLVMVNNLGDVSTKDIINIRDQKELNNKINDINKDNDSLASDLEKKIDKIIENQDI